MVKPIIKDTFFSFPRRLNLQQKMILRWAKI